MEQLDLFKKEAEKKKQVLKPPKEIEIKTTNDKIKTGAEEKKYVQLIKPLSKKSDKKPSKRGRKSFKEINLDVALLEIPDDETLAQKQYYSITEVAEWFHVNSSLLRFWEKEFDILKPRKNRKGDRMFRPDDIKNLRIIYYLLRQQKYSMEGAKQFLKDNHKRAEMQTRLVETLTKLRSFLLELKANLGA